MLLKNLIKDSPKRFEKLKIKGLALNSKDVKKGFIFLQLKEINQTEKIISIMPSKMEQLLLFALHVVNLKI